MTATLEKLIDETATRCANASHNTVLTSTAKTACKREITALVEKILAEIEPEKPKENQP